ncbi:MAG TPA: flagellar motor protein MotB [Acidobacteriaceae bacterium]|jgi:chemotaxis protein MotB|nr:flagellar motor protein MotB [Acidobacteriaceae bacterium]
MSRKIRHSHVSHERWLVSYADFITLLFAFFVVMFASSRQDHAKVKQVESSIREAFQSLGVFPADAAQPSLSSATLVPPDGVAMVTAGDDVTSLPGEMEDLNTMQRKMESLLAAQIAGGTVAITLGRGGLLISLRDAGFFESGSAIPMRSSLPTLHVIGRGIAGVLNSVRIEGHTDDIPISNSQYASNWELSTARATELTRLFIEDDHVQPARLSAAGYAQYHPIASNVTAEGRSRNRRVDIIVLPTRQPPARMNRQLAHSTSYVPPVGANSQKVQEFLLRASRTSLSFSTILSSRRAR